MREFLTFPFFEKSICLWDTGGGRGGGKEERQRCGPQQQRGVPLMAGGGRKSQDLVFDVKPSNSHRHSSDGAVGGRCTTTLHTGVGIVFSPHKYIILGAIFKWNIPTYKQVHLKC